MEEKCGREEDTLLRLSTSLNHCKYPKGGAQTSVKPLSHHCGQKEWKLEANFAHLMDFPITSLRWAPYTLTEPSVKEYARDKLNGPGPFSVAGDRYQHSA